LTGARERRRSTPESVAARRELRGQLTDPAPVMEAAAAFLAARPRSLSETTRRLLRLGYPPPLVDEVVARLAEIGYLDDAGFARSWVESRDRVRPRGSNALRRELMQKGVSRDAIDEALAARADVDRDPDRVAALALLERKRPSLEREADPRRRRQKAYALLARNGFDPETCTQVAAAFGAAAGVAAIAVEAGDAP
jgi:regulatory protein